MEGNTHVPNIAIVVPYMMKVNTSNANSTNWLLILRKMLLRQDRPANEFAGYTNKVRLCGLSWREKQALYAHNAGFSSPRRGTLYL